MVWKICSSPLVSSHEWGRVASPPQLFCVLNTGEDQSRSPDFWSSVPVSSASETADTALDGETLWGLFPLHRVLTGLKSKHKSSYNYPWISHYILFFFKRSFKGRSPRLVCGSFEWWCLLLCIFASSQQLGVTWVMEGNIVIWYWWMTDFN